MLDEADELYGLPLDEFTAARDALAKRLRGEKRREDADAVKALKRPSVAAGAINLAVREHGADDLLAAGEELRSAHEALLEGSGDAAAVRAATERERAAVRELRPARARRRRVRGDGGEGPRDAPRRVGRRRRPRAARVAGRLEREAEAGVDAMELMAAAGGEARAKSGSAARSRAPRHRHEVGLRRHEVGLRRARRRAAPAHEVGRAAASRHEGATAPPRRGRARPGQSRHEVGRLRHGVGPVRGRAAAARGRPSARRRRRTGR